LFLQEAASLIQLISIILLAKGISVSGNYCNYFNESTVCFYTAFTFDSADFAASSSFPTISGKGRHTPQLMSPSDFSP
jgi:hypothetical protein